MLGRLRRRFPGRSGIGRRQGLAAWMLRDTAGHFIVVPVAEAIGKKLVEILAAELRLLAEGLQRLRADLAGFGLAIAKATRVLDRGLRRAERFHRAHRDL